jgi:hypothetical protein
MKNLMENMGRRRKKKKEEEERGRKRKKEEEEELIIASRAVTSGVSYFSIASQRRCSLSAGHLSSFCRVFEWSFHD